MLNLQRLEATVILQNPSNGIYSWLMLDLNINRVGCGPKSDSVLCRFTIKTNRLPYIEIHSKDSSKM